MSYKIEFEEINNKTLQKLTSLIKERDNYCKNYIMKIYRQNDYQNLGRAYNIFYSSFLWKECVKPLLIAWGIKKKLITPYICPICLKDLVSWKQITPHHKTYPSLTKKYNYHGFDKRMFMNHPSKISFMCIECHRKIHKKGDDF